MAEPVPLSPQDVSIQLGGIDADVLERLGTYIDVLKKWQTAINLVGPKTLTDPWRRHILDSAQIVPLLGGAESIADLGSGAGLPGLIVAIMTGRPVTLIESDQRKAAFLREAARATGTEIDVRAQRIEAVPPLPAEAVTARALAPLEKLLPLVARHLKNGGKAVLLKGAEADRELTEAAEKWTMDIKKTESLTDSSATILTLTGLAPKHVG